MIEMNEKPKPISFKREYVLSLGAAKIVVRLLIDKPGAPATFAVIRVDEDTVRLQMSARSEEWLMGAIREHLDETSDAVGAFLHWLEVV